MSDIAKDKDSNFSSKDKYISDSKDTKMNSKKKFSIIGFISNLISLFFSYFVNGILIIVPFILTFYVISKFLKWFNSVIGLGMPLGGIIFILFFILFCGYFAKSFVINFFYDIVEFAVMKIPGISFLYSSVKDFTFAFIDKKVKFDKPVLICINVVAGEKRDIKKIGFITNENLENLNLKDHVAVFVPQSFSFSLSGEFLVLPKKNVIELKGMDGANIMRFIVTGGFIDN
jgi:uncharacterized membrane protein